MPAVWSRVAVLATLAASAVPLLASAVESHEPFPADVPLELDDECLAVSGDEQEQCALNALQRRGLRMTRSSSESDSSELLTQAEAARRAIPPPKRAVDYNGMAWPNLTISGKGPQHIFAIGDWGGMDGSLEPIEGRPRVIVYSGGHTAGPHVFPRSRYNKMHTAMICNHTELVECFETRGQKCKAECGFVKGIDDQAQQLVASAFRARAAKSNPQYVLNVGDNFYWGGIEKTCGTPMSQISSTAQHQFTQIFESMYYGEGVENKPWLSVLGNHDWGGRQFNNGWDQQIAFTWASKRWVLPALYWSQNVVYKDLGFSVDYYMIDSNMNDAKDPEEDPEHNMCGEKHNPANANCSMAGGPGSVAECKDYFWNLWAEQQKWLVQKLKESKADWQIVVTHFPCGEQAEFYRELYNSYGLDLLVTGHRHDQELWDKGSRVSDELGGLVCFVTGGGGGITSEADPSNTTQWYGEGQYGFYDLTISKEKIVIESINWNSTITKNTTVFPNTKR